MDPFHQAQARYSTHGGLPWGKTGGGYVEDMFATFGHGTRSKLESEREAGRKENALKRRFQVEQEGMRKELAEWRAHSEKQRTFIDYQLDQVEILREQLSNAAVRTQHGDTSSGRARVPSVQDSDEAVVSEGRGGGSVPVDVAGDGAASRKGGVSDNGVRPEGEGVVPADAGDAEGRDAHDNEAGSPGAGGLREAEDGEGEVGS